MVIGSLKVFKVVIPASHCQMKPNIVTAIQANDLPLFETEDGLLFFGTIWEAIQIRYMFNNFCNIVVKDFQTGFWYSLDDLNRA